MKSGALLVEFVHVCLGDVLKALLPGRGEVQQHAPSAVRIADAFDQPGLLCALGQADGPVMSDVEGLCHLADRDGAVGLGAEDDEQRVMLWCQSEATHDALTGVGVGGEAAAEGGHGRVGLMGVRGARVHGILRSCGETVALLRRTSELHHTAIYSSIAALGRVRYPSDPPSQAVSSATHHPEVPFLASSPAGTTELNQ